MIQMKASIVLILLLPLSSAYASDWQLIGGAQTGKEAQVVFFDAESVEHNGDTIRVWIEGVPRKVLKRYFNKGLDAKLLDATASKVATGYVPPFATLQSLKGKYADTKAFQDDIIDISSQEVIVNTMGVRIASKIYFEIQCKEKRISTLSASIFRKDGSLEQSSDSEYHKTSYIAPDSNGERLLQVLCPKS